MDFKTAILTCVKDKYATFEGRASRSEYWFYQLFYFIAYLGSAIFGFMISDRAALMFPIIILLALFLPTIGVLARRLHDINRSAWWMLVLLIPIVGVIIMVVWCIKQGDDDDNKFGQNPLKIAV